MTQMTGVLLITFLRRSLVSVYVLNVGVVLQLALQELLPDSA